MNALQMNEAIRAEVTSRITTYPCNNLRASNIGHPCERYLYLLIKHWDEQKPHGYGLQNIFDLGNAIEPYTINKLKAAGFEVFTPENKNFKVDNPLITGREDIRIKDPSDNELYPAEIKGLSPFEWERLDSIEDFYTSKRHHVRGYPSQLLTYMWHFNKERGYFVLTNKLTGEVKVIDVPFDWDRMDEMIKRAERVYAALADKFGQTIPEACNDIDVCDGCNLAHICTAFKAHVEADIDTGELEDLIQRKEALAAAYKDYNDVHDQIKKCVGARDKIVTDGHLVQVSTIFKKAYEVKEHSERRINISRL